MLILHDLPPHVLRTVSLPDEDELENVQQGSMTNLCQECRNVKGIFGANSWSPKKRPDERYRDFNKFNLNSFFGSSKAFIVSARSGSEFWVVRFFYEIGCIETALCFFFWGGGPKYRWPSKRLEMQTVYIYICTYA